MQQALQLRQSKQFLTLGNAGGKEVDAQHCSSSGSHSDRGSTRNLFDQRCSAGGGGLNMPLISDLSETDSTAEQKQTGNTRIGPAIPCAWPMMRRHFFRRIED